MATPVIRSTVSARPRLKRYTHAHTESCARVYAHSDDDGHIPHDQHFFDVFTVETKTGVWALSMEKLPRPKSGPFANIPQPLTVKMHVRLRRSNKIIQVI